MHCMFYFHFLHADEEWKAIHFKYSVLILSELKMPSRFVQSEVVFFQRNVKKGEKQVPFYGKILRLITLF